MKLTNFILTLITLAVLGALSTYVLDYTNAYDFSNIWEGTRADLILPSSTVTTFAIIGLKFFSGMFLNNQNKNNEKVIRVLTSLKEQNEDILLNQERQYKAEIVNMHKNINSKLIGETITNLSKEWLEEFDKVLKIDKLEEIEEQEERFDI